MNVEKGELEDLRDRIQRGVRAQALLRDPMFQDLMNDLEQTYTDMVFQSCAEDTQGRENAYWANVGRQTVIASLQQYANDKDIAIEALEAIEAETDTE